MKAINAAVAAAVILLGFVVAGTAMAGPYGHGGYYGRGGYYYGHGGGVRFSLGVGVPLGWYGYYPSPYYNYYYPPYYSPGVTVPYESPTYIEQPVPVPQAAPAPQGFWYYCADAKAYYPYVNQCAGGWQRVSPAPPPG